MLLKNSWDRKRVIILLVLGLGILGLCLFGGLSHPWVSTSDCETNPSAFDGRLVEHFSEPMIGEFYGDGFLLLQKNRPSMRVVCDTTGLMKNHYIGLSAIYHKEGYLEADSIIVARRRRSKIWLSVIPVILIAGLLLRDFRFDRKRFQLELKDHA